MNNVHFAIPEIYGETLSYYELLRKLVEKTNELIDNYNTVPEQIAEAVANLDASQLFSEVLNQLIHSIATDNTKSANAVKVYKKHDLLYATFNETVSLYESLIDFSTGTATELIPGTNIREVNISELFIELRKLIDINKNNIEAVTAVSNENSAAITTIHDNITVIENKNTEQDNEITTLHTMISTPYNFKGDVDSISALPASGNVNDTYYVKDVKYKVTWTGSAWAQSSLSEADYQTELSELKGDITQISERTKNIFEGKMEQGNITAGNNSDNIKEYYVRSSDYTEVDGDYATLSYFAPMNAGVAYFYDTNKSYISYREFKYGDEGGDTRRSSVLTLPSGTKYIRFKIFGSNGINKYTPNDVSRVQIELGNQVSYYVYPYTAKDETARHIANSKASIEDIQSELKVKSNYAGNFINLNPVSTIKTRVYFDVPPSENETWNVKQYGKNMATFAQSESISSTKNNITYFSVDMPMEKGHTYTISYKQTGQLESALQNSIVVDIGGVKYLSPKNLDAGVVIFKFVAPVTRFANVGIYTYNLSADINISEFQIEYGEERTEFVSPIYKANSINVTPTTEYVDLLIEPFEGVNNIGVYKDAHMEVSCYENDIAIYNKIDAEQVIWNIACGNIVCIGDSLTDGLYAPISKGKIKQNYPYYLGRLLNAEVDNIGKSGSYPSEVFNTIYPSQDFSKYDTAIIWLGTNGGLFNDFSDGTQADYYCKLIEGIKSQKSDIQLFIGTVFVTGEINSGVSYASIKETNETIKVIAERYSIPIIDFSDLTSSGVRLLHNMQDNTHFGKSGNIYIANRIANFMQKYFKEDITRVEFGLLPKTTN